MRRILAPCAAAALVLSACAPAAGGADRTARPTRIAYEPVSPALPAIPAADGPLDIRVIHPTGGMTRPRVDSTFIYGSVGTGRAALAIGGVSVPVAPNGAFLAYLPVPEDGTWRLHAVAGQSEDREVVAYAEPRRDAPSPAAASTDETFASPRLGTVAGGADTLRTGSDAVYARPTPTGTYRWFFPRGARLTLTERRGDQYRVQLGANTEAFIDADAVALADAAPPALEAVGAVSVVRAGEAYDVRIPAGGRPFLVEPSDSAVVVTLYGTGGADGEIAAAADDFVRGASSRPLGTATQYVLRTAAPAWGYKAWYGADGDLVVRVRRPPPIDPANPLRGIRIVIDPGHPPAGATGPTGLYEGEANLAIALPLAETLRARGAEVVLTKTGSEPLDLRPRVELAAERDAHLLISVHNNAFGEGANPFRAHGTSVYYFHPTSADLARALNEEIVAVTRIPDLGARQGNLALARPTWMPSALTESLFMPIPEQEAALRDPAFVDRLAEAHVRGIEAFLRGRAGAAR